MVFEEATMMAKVLGIPETDLTQAIVLIRELRIKAYYANLDPRATRIALLYAVKGDLEFAKDKLSERELKTLDDIAENIFREMITRVNNLE